MAVEERNDALKHGYPEPVERYEWARERLKARTVEGLTLVADVGCGYGYGTKILMAEGGIVSLGCDVSSDAIAYAKIHYGDHPFVVADAERNTFGGFDAVVCLEALSHFDGPGMWLRLLDVPVLVVSAPMIPSTHIYPFRKHDIPVERFREMVSAKWHIEDELNQRDRYLTLLGVR